MLLVGHEFHPMQGLKLIGPAALLCLAAMSAATEYPRMVKVGVGPRMSEGRTPKEGGGSYPKEGKGDPRGLGSYLCVLTYSMSPLPYIASPPFPPITAAC